MTLQQLTQYRLGNVVGLLVCAVLGYEISVKLRACFIHNTRCLISCFFEGAQIVLGFCPVTLPLGHPSSPNNSLNVTVKPGHSLATNFDRLLQRRMLFQKSREC